MTVSTPRSRHIWSRALVCFAGLVLSCAPAPPRAPSKTLLGPEDTARAEIDVIVSGPLVAGFIEPEQRAQIRAEAAGTVTDVRVETGERVRAGTRLASIEETALRERVLSAQSAVTSARERLQVARQQLERLRKLEAVAGASERELEVARSEVSSAQAQLEQAKAELAVAREGLEGATVLSPLTGRVSMREVSAGDVVAEGTLLFVVIDPSTMRLRASVPASALNQVRTGMQVQFQVRGRPQERFRGRLTQIAPSVDPATRQVEVLVSIPNPEGRLLDGLFAEGRLALRQLEAVVVPLAAVDQTTSPPTALVVRHGQVEQTSLQLGIVDTPREQAQVRAGLRPGAIVLKGPARTIPPGTPVQLESPATARAD